MVRRGRQESHQQPTSDHYATLEVRPEAPHDEIRKSYRRLALANHPDKAPSAEREAATRKLTEINAAWGVLGDADRRRVYDLQRDVEQPSSSASHGFSGPRSKGRPRGLRFLLTGRTSAAVFGPASRLRLLRSHAFSPLVRSVQRGAAPCLLFIHLGGSERSKRLAAILEEVQAALGRAVTMRGVDVEADPPLAERFRGSAELPAMLILSRERLQPLPPPYTVELIVASTTEMLPLLPRACTPSELRQLVKVSVQRRAAAALALAPAAALKQTLRIACAANGLTCATVPHKRCRLPEPIMSCPGITLLDRQGGVQRCVAAVDAPKALTRHAALFQGPLLGPLSFAASSATRSAPARNLMSTGTALRASPICGAAIAAQGQLAVGAAALLVAWAMRASAGGGGAAGGRRRKRGRRLRSARSWSPLRWFT